MNDTKRDALHEAILTALNDQVAIIVQEEAKTAALPCPFCGAPAGRPCRSRASGFREPSFHVHASRAQRWVRYGAKPKQP